MITIKATSSGFNGLDLAKVSINGTPVSIEANESGHHRGLNIVVVDPSNGKILVAKAFDTFKTSFGLDTFIGSKSIPEGSIVAVACKDECTANLSIGAK